MRKTDTQSRLQQNKYKLYQETNKAHKNTLKEEILQAVNENFIELLPGHGQSKHTKGTQEIPSNKNKEYKKTKKTPHELTHKSPK
jgi:hypothetical protein